MNEKLFSSHCTEGHRFPISDCPHMKGDPNDTSMSTERYICEHCGLRDYLDYEEMK